MENANYKPKFAVIGAGHGGLAMAGHLALMGFQVNLYNRSKERLWGIHSTGGISIESDFGLEGFGVVNLATTDIGEAIDDVDIIMVVVPANAHRHIAEISAPHLKDGQIVILNPGRTFGALEFKQVLNLMNVKADVIIAETQTFIYASRATNPGQVHIFRIKNSIPLASIRAHLIPEVLKKIRLAYPQFVPGDNIFKTSFDNIGAVFHPTLCVLNAGWIEDDAEFQFYVEGATPSVTKVLEKIDEERCNVMKVFGVEPLTSVNWLKYAYDVVGKNLYEAIHNNSGYQGILAPPSIDNRYITEDVPMSLVPI
ncbi:MAG: NAD/NADP octopine/nopaline dehydrogenase family protein, partial [Melioribacter sp.]|nr:NAD/NADP octopine/nopaline dehydrogenase family protein [Melioribacter sp.]